MTVPLHAALYLRVSTVRQAEHDVSIPDQKRQGEAYWRAARQAAGIKGLHFHDLRHEGVSRMAEKGLTIGELAEQSGHRTAQVLLRYVNAKVSEVAKKLG